MPEVGGARPISILMVVDFPAPFGPRNPKKQPRRDGKAQTVDGGLPAINLAEIPDLDGRIEHSLLW